MPDCSQLGFFNYICTIKFNQMYYVYLHKNPKTGEPFYVGRGAIGRAYNFYSRPSYWKDYVKKNGEPIVELIASMAIMKESAQIEIETINKYKRVIDGGVLLNKAIGGIGPTGYVQSEHAKNKISKTHKNKVVSIETKNKVRESVKKYFNCVEARTKLSIGIKRSKLFQEKMKDVNENKKKIILDTQTGIYYMGIQEAANVLNIKKVTLGGKLNGHDNNNTSMIYV